MALPWRTNGGLTMRAGDALAADVHLDRARGGGRQPREADRALERRRERAARELALAGRAREDFLVRAQHAALEQQQAR